MAVPVQLSESLGIYITGNTCIAEPREAQEGRGGGVEAKAHKGCEDGREMK